MRRRARVVRIVGLGLLAAVLAAIVGAGIASGGSSGGEATERRPAHQPV
jgi:hypothetical protein